MGLDQYLTKRTSVNTWMLTNALEAGLKPKIILEDFPGIDVDQISGIIENVGSWRKCPAIHYWFVENVQDGEDDCKDYELGASQLEELLQICEDIWENYEENSNNHGQPNDEAKEYAEENLPNMEGFFFGNQEYDKDYFHWQIKPTIDMLKPLVEAEYGTTEDPLKPMFFSWYVYQSSW